MRLQLWDIAGQDRFVHLTRAYFTRGKGGREGGRLRDRAATPADFFILSVFTDDPLVPPPSLSPSFAPQAKGVLVVCDLTRENTFDAVKAWKREIDEWARTEGREAGIPVVLIANKVHSIVLETLVVNEEEIGRTR